MTKTLRPIVAMNYYRTLVIPKDTDAHKLEYAELTPVPEMVEAVKHIRKAGCRVVAISSVSPDYGIDALAELGVRAKDQFFREEDLAAVLDRLGGPANVLAYVGVNGERVGPAVNVVKVPSAIFNMDDPPPPRPTGSVLSSAVHALPVESGTPIQTYLHHLIRSTALTLDNYLKWMREEEVSGAKTIIGVDELTKWIDLQLETFDRSAMTPRALISATTVQPSLGFV